MTASVRVTEENRVVTLTESFHINTLPFLDYLLYFHYSANLHPSALSASTANSNLSAATKI